MKLSLPREVEAGSAMKAFHRRRRKLLDVESRLARRVHFFVEEPVIVLGSEEQVAADAAEVGVDPFLRADALDARDRRPVAVARETRAVGTVQPDHLGVSIVDDVRQVRCRHSGLTAAGCAVVDQHDRPSLARQQVRRRHTGDPGADHADVRGRLTGERRLT